MVLIGMLDSPFVRRVAITMQMFGIDYRHRPLSIFKSFDEFRLVHPLVKVPTLVCDDGEMLVDSTLIIDHLESLSGPTIVYIQRIHQPDELRCNKSGKRWWEWRKSYRSFMKRDSDPRNCSMRHGSTVSSNS